MRSSFSHSFVFALVASLTLAASASANTITFDDLPQTGNNVGALPSNYQGMNWSNWGYETPATHTPVSGYMAGTVSGPNVAYNANGTLAGISNTLFDLNSGYFTAAWNDNLQLTISGFNGLTQIYTHTYTLSATAPTFITLNYLQITSVSFNSFGGTPHGYPSGGGTQFVLDNLTVNATAAPLPPALFAGAPLLLSFAATSLLRRKSPALAGT